MRLPSVANLPVNAAGWGFFLCTEKSMRMGRGGEYVGRFSPDGSPSKLVGLVVQWVLLVFVIVSAVGTLNIPAVTGFVNLVLSYLPNVIAIRGNSG